MKNRGSSGVFLCRLSRTEERGDVRRRPCEEPLVGAPTLWPIPEASGALICCTLFLGVLGLRFGLIELGFRII
ncbi:hypothetical protein ES319_A13G202100v1 [Gossypium barbadense]|uniref:Uncharacterized protein n=1 Tax=Gossypium barbadense TaxID=3634 RepID=A0A5J5T1P2_GOSBA|nr:hypothetical protein ES319_A13G202100v1 [Gossypium barbadense]